MGQSRHLKVVQAATAFRQVCLQHLSYSSHI